MGVTYGVPEIPEGVVTYQLCTMDGIAVMPTVSAETGESIYGTHY